MQWDWITIRCGTSQTNHFVSYSTANPAKQIAVESEEISRPAQFSAQAGNGVVRGISEPADKPISRIYDGYYRQLNFSV